MRITNTHTYANLVISESALNEIRNIIKQVAKDTRDNSYLDWIDEDGNVMLDHIKLCN